jgi:hypothetical protein
MSLLLLRPVLAVLAAAALLLTACGGGERDRTKAQVRLLNASAYPALDLRVDGALLQGGVAYGEQEAYGEIRPSRSETVIRATGSATELLRLQPGVARDRFYTWLAYGPVGALALLQIEEELRRPAAGRSLLRVVNAAPDAGTVNVYLTAPGDDLAAAVPFRAGVAPGTAAEAAELGTATWRLRVTAAGSKTDLRLDVPTIALADRGIGTLVLAGPGGGALVDALLLVQQGTITRTDNTQARVRVAAGVADGGTVGASVAGQTLLAGVGSPAVTNYTLLPAGNQPVAVTIDGAILPQPPVALPRAQDLSLLVHGTPTQPRADWIVDDNRLPADATTARVRLVNGVSGAPGTLSMTVDFLPVADGVPAGSASPPAAVAANALARIEVRAAGLGRPLWTALEQRLEAGTKYTLFLVGDAAEPVGIVRRDR